MIVLARLFLLLPLATAEAQLPPSLASHVDPVFPAELKGTSVTDGYVTVAYVVRLDGAIDDAVALEATHAAFATAVLDVLPSWRFSPVVDAVPRREVLRLLFQQTGAVTPLSHRDATKAAFPLALAARLPIRTVGWPELTAPPERLASPSPATTATSGGNVAISYVIDTQGRVRVPAVVGESDPGLAAAAVAAVKQWRFTPPLHNGLPVLVEDTRSFTFAARP